MSFYVISCLIFLAGCGTSSTKEKSSPWPPDMYYVSKGASVLVERLTVDSIGNNLYSDKDGTIYFKTERVEDDGYSRYPMLLTRLSDDCDTGSSLDLNKNIDVRTFEVLNSTNSLYYKDRNRVYFFNSYEAGGDIVVLAEADSRTFRTILGSCYATDKDQAFYLWRRIPGAKPKTFEGIYKFRTGDTVCYFAKDSKHYFSGSDTCSLAEVMKYLKE